jgi:thymidylate synthase
MNNLDARYQALLEDILQWGVEKKDRTGTGTISVFGRQIRHKMSEGFPLLTTKKLHWNSIVTELLWFLRGETNIKFLLDYDCNIWNGDAYKRYERANTWELQDTPPMNEFIKRIKEDETFRKTWGELGPIYGKQWRKWELPNYSVEHVEYGHDNNLYVDQIQNLINELKTNPDSRRLMVNAWNVGELDQMVLPPCHYGFQVYTRKLSFDERYRIYSGSNETWEESGGNTYGKINGLDMMDDANIPTRTISLMWNQRSVDTFLGLPFNIASYGLLLSIIAKEVNMIPEDLIGNLGDVHLYSNHLEQAKEQISRTPYELPTVKITERNWYMHEKVKEHLGEKTLDEKIKSYRPDCFELIGYESHPKIKAPLSN